MSVHLRVIAPFVRRRPRGVTEDGAGLAGRVRDELELDLPDEDLGDDLDDALALYRTGSKPRCEEAEYLRLVREAIDRIERGH